VSNIWQRICQRHFDALHPAQRSHSQRTAVQHCAWPLCGTSQGPLSRQPAQTPCGGLSVPFPTSPPPQGDPEAEVGNGTDRKPAAQAGGTTGGGNHRGTLPTTPGFPGGFPHTPFLTPPSPPRPCYEGPSQRTGSTPSWHGMADGAGGTSGSSSTLICPGGYSRLDHWWIFDRQLTPFRIDDIEFAVQVVTE
jgi:hypothetical protein